MILLSALLERAGIVPDAMEGDAELTAISADTRQLQVGSLFICMPSANTDTHALIPQAVENGAVAVLAHSNAGWAIAEKVGVPCAVVQDFEQNLWRLCREFYDNPTRAMKVLGVTGTNGKTTTAWLVRDMLQALGVPAAYLGTLGFQLPGEERELANTTPFSVELFSMLAEARDKGVKALAMEVSSHALAERRVDGVEFDAAVFTNLTQDHLDYHGSMDEYERSKLRLFTDLPKQTAKNFKMAINMDDPTGAVWLNRLPGAIGYGIRDGDLHGTPIHVGFESVTLKLETWTESVEVTAPLGGMFNLMNCLSAAAGMLALGYTLEQIKEALPQVRPVPGRFEPVPNDKGISIIVDYAHTPDALEKLLDSVRDLKPAHVVTVFGCGGDRDRTKRPQMAKAASERSDLTVLTSDNPRTEDPEAILREIEGGLVPGASAVTIVDRREAIACSLRKAGPGDVVVIAGKGHENYQIIGRTKYPMDDREIAREALRS